uniref:Putative salivary lipocalin n=1 Tax=Ixodes ricinus TaxID=34613 RepID=A0A0K8RML6_IXORI
MKTFFGLLLATLCGFTSCKAAEVCNCHPEGRLDFRPEVLVYRDAWDFLTSSETVYLMYFPATLFLGATRCVISKLSGTPNVFPNVYRRILYLDATKGPQWQSISVTLTMQDKTASESSSSFSIKGFDKYGKFFPVVFVDSKCLIFRILSNINPIDHRTGCAWWVKEKAKDNLLLHCKLIYLLFCGTSHQTVYNKVACDYAYKANKE